MGRFDSAELGPVLLDADRLAHRVAELGRQLTADYAGRDPLVVGVLSGGAVFTADLVRAVELALELDWIAVSSYGRGSTSSGNVALVKDLAIDVAGRHVLVVDDILDTGLTLAWLLDVIGGRRPASIECAVLLRKPDAVVEPVRPRYVGFDIPPVFVAGYGIDYAGRHRNLPDIREVILPRRVSP